MRVGRAAQTGYPSSSRPPSASSACVGAPSSALGPLGPLPLGRRRASSWLRTALLLFMVTFVWLQLHVANIGGGGGASRGQDAVELNESAAILSMVPQVLHKYLVVKPRFHNHSVSAVSGNSSDGLSASGASLVGGGQPPDIAEIQRQIERYNEQQTVLNEDLFGTLTNSSLVIVIQVHTRVIYLRHLIVSLAQAKDIDQALLIFSHDYYDEETNELVQSVDFCKVMQIFYPFSIQTHPDRFPGESANDCPRDMKREQALITKCNNAEHPDLYGHYREAKFTQTKHHWWWKANRVFNELEVTRNYTGLVLFLEEDHFVAEDFIHVLRLMQKTCSVSCPQCNILSLGTYLKTYNYYGGDARKKDVLRVLKRAQPAPVSITPSWNFQILPSLFQHYQKADVTPWISSKHNMGMAFNRTVWNQIRACSTHFCRYDDYNWDWSLQHVSYNCLPQKLHAMVMKGPRIFHIGECGVHHKKSNCESTAVISKVQKVLRTASRHLYPSHLTLTVATNPKKTKLRKGNGGWGDIRDHNLCLSISNSSVR